MGIEEGDGRGISVPWLLAVRYVVAIAVGVLAFGMVVLVLTTMDRPEEIQVVVNRGFVTMHDLHPPSLSPSPSPAPHDGRRRLLLIAHEDPTFGRSMLSVRIVLTVSSPSGRGDDEINCTNIVVGLVDILSPSSFASVPGSMETILLFQFDNFTLPKESSHEVAKTTRLNDGAQLNYILNRHYDSYVFQVAVMVELLATPINNGIKKGHGSNYTFHCWPITVNDAAYSDDIESTDDVHCSRVGHMMIPRLRQFQAPPPS